MRMLFTSRPTLGHIQPLLPLADAARAAGHEVMFATAAEALPDLAERGFELFAAGEGPDPTVVRTFLEGSTVPLEQQRMFAFTTVFATREMKSRLDDLEPLIRSHRPHVLIHEIAEFAGPLAATVSGVPLVTVGVGPLLDPAVANATAKAAAHHWHARGLEVARWAGFYRDLYIDPSPPALQVSDIEDLPAVQAMRTQDGQAGPPPAWVAGLTRPLVYATFGTIFNKNVDAFGKVIQALADLPVEVLTTVGKDNDPAAFGAQPPHIRIERFVPQNDVLGHCRLVISHGGSGTMLGALAFGLPLLLLPQGADQLFNAQRCCSAGVATMLRPEEASVEAIAREASRLLREPSFATTARSVAAQIRAMPSPEDAVARVERLVA